MFKRILQGGTTVALLSCLLLQGWSLQTFADQDMVKEKNKSSNAPKITPPNAKESSTLIEGINVEFDPVRSLDRVVAVVNKDVITESELITRIQFSITQMEKQKISIPAQPILEKQVLEQIILEKLQEQYAKNVGIKIDDGLLDKTVEKIAEENNIDVFKLRETLGNNGISYETFRENLRYQILVSKIREKEINSRVYISEEELAQTLRLRSKEVSQDEYEVGHILIRSPDNISPEMLKKLRVKAEDALSRLKKGETFGQVSASYSDTPNALEGGNIGWKSTTQLPELFVNTLKNLKTGKVSEILHSPKGFHILKLFNKRGGVPQVVVTQIHAKHILIKMNEKTSEKEALSKIQFIKKRLEQGESFSKLAKENSEDGSASQGGDLGWVSHGDTVPEFEKALFQLAIGQTSDIVQSPFGFHLIQSLEKRQQDISLENERKKVRLDLQLRKSEDLYQDWLSELRDRSFVEIRLDDKS